MAKKNRKKSAKRAQAPARFAVGALVRVRPGVTDPDFPDVPLGGWAGTIHEIEASSAPPTYLIEWNKYTLDHMHPIYRKRCERDGLELESMWLGEDDIEPDTGGPAILEQPTNIVTAPLEADDEDDRVRLALGRTSDDPLPEVGDDTLRTYHRYLAAQLKFPFEASWTYESGPLSDTTSTVTITDLVDPEDDPSFDETYGLFAEAKSKGRVTEVPLSECEAKQRGPNRQLLQDYVYWFWNYR
jgi:hypothetical protein